MPTETDQSMNVSIATRKLLHNCHAPVSRNTFDMEKVEKNFSRDLPGINLAYFYHSADGGGRGEGGEGGRRMGREEKEGRGGEGREGGRRTGE